MQNYERPETFSIFKRIINETARKKGAGRMKEFRTSIPPYESASILLKEIDKDDVKHQEYHDIGEGKQMCVLVFERYYFRTSGNASLTVIMENMNGITNVRCISSGSAEQMVFKFDLGAGKNFAAWAERVLSEYLI